MSRIVLPEDFVSQRTLFDDIKAKHDADGASSPLIPKLTQDSIDLDADAIDAGKADIKDKRRTVQAGISENMYELRDKLITPVEKHLRGEGQFLKIFYKPIITTLNDWGYNIVGGKKIVIPSNFIDLTTLSTNVKAQHDSFIPPTVSPLVPYLTQQEISMTDDATDVANAIIDHNNAVAAEGASEQATEDRNGFWNPVWAHVVIIADFLMKLYANNPQKLTEWGIVVDHSKQKPKERTSTILLSSRKTINSVVIGSTLKNTGTVEIHVYYGKTTTGTPIIVPAGEMLGIKKGGSVLTIVNPSALVSAKFVTTTY